MSTERFDFSGFLRWYYINNKKPAAKTATDVEKFISVLAASAKRQPQEPKPKGKKEKSVSKNPEIPQETGEDKADGVGDETGEPEDIEKTAEKNASGEIPIFIYLL